MAHARLAEEREHDQASHVERGHQRGHETNQPEQAVGMITAADVARVIADGKNVNDVRIYQLLSVSVVDSGGGHLEVPDDQ